MKLWDYDMVDNEKIGRLRMGNCFNILEKPEVFVAITALIAIVLLVWAQLYARGAKNLDKNFNLWCGILWTYAALLFALIAVGVLVLYGKENDWAKGFLILSFLMTVTNILIVVVMDIFKIIYGIPADESVTKVGTGCCNRLAWGSGWLIFGVGLGILSIGYALECSYWWIGILLFGIVVVVAIVVVVRTIWRYRMRNYISWCLRETRIYMVTTVELVAEWFRNLFKKND